MSENDAIPVGAPAPESGPADEPRYTRADPDAIRREAAEKGYEPQDPAIPSTGGFGTVITHEDGGQTFVDPPGGQDSWAGGFIEADAPPPPDGRWHAGLSATEEGRWEVYREVQEPHALIRHYAQWQAGYFDPQDPARDAQAAADWLNTQAAQGDPS